MLFWKHKLMLLLKMSTGLRMIALQKTADLRVRQTLEKTMLI